MADDSRLGMTAYHGEKLIPTLSAAGAGLVQSDSGTAKVRPPWVIKWQTLPALRTIPVERVL